jgi:glycine betaine catabolism A
MYISIQEICMTTMEQSSAFTCLPRERYVEDAWFDRDVAEVTSRQWLYFCHVSQIPETGDILERELGNESIIATRDGDGVVHAFYNVCRHRGYRICDAGPSSSKQIVCPYHRWSFGLDGTLIGAPTLRDGEDLDYAEYGLKRVAVETWRGFVFVALGPEPPRTSLADDLAEAGRAFDVYEPERLKLAHEVEYEVECNWKVLLENFLECYHCPGSHPELCGVTDVPSLFQATEEGADKFLAQEYSWGGFPLRPGVESLTISGERACQLSLGKVDADTSPFSLSIQPTLTALGFVIDYGILHQFMPTSTGRSRWTAQWFVHPDAVEGEDYDVETLIGLWHATNLQDVALCERTQLGVNSRSFVPGPNSLRREPMIRSALASYHQLLGEAAEFEALTGAPFSDR